MFHFLVPQMLYLLLLDPGTPMSVPVARFHAFSNDIVTFAGIFYPCWIVLGISHLSRYLQLIIIQVMPLPIPRGMSTI